VDGFPSDHDVNDAIWIPFQKYATGSPVAGQEREDDFEN
jgi:hypothetical protein